MTIYDLLRILIRAASEMGRMKPAEAFAALDLINKLESVNAFGTQAVINQGKDIRDV